MSSGRLLRWYFCLVLALSVAGCARGGGGKVTDKIPPSPDGSPVLAKVGDYVVTAKQVEDRIKESGGSEQLETNLQNPDIIQVALSSILDQIVWGRVAEAEGYGKDPQIRRAIYLYGTELMARAYLGDKIDKQADPTEEEIQDFYKKYADHYRKPVRASVRHIMCSSREKCEEALKKYLAGTGFADLARQYSEDQNTRDLGGALGYVSEEEGVLGLGRDPAFLKAALALKKGDVSPVVQSARGYHIILCEDREGGDERPLEEVRDDIVKRVKSGGKLSDVYNYALVDARKKYGAVIFQSAVDKYTGVSDSAERLWSVVEEQPNERGQIEVLRRISFDFPNNPLADDAQLRIAYLYAVKLDEPKRALKALTNMKTRFPKSELIPAANWLEAHINDPQIDLKSFDELKAKAGQH